MQEIKVKRKSTLMEYKDNKEYEAFTGGKIYYASKHERIKNCYVIRDNYLNPKIITERTLNTCFDFISYMEDIDHMENKSTITYKETEHLLYSSIEHFFICLEEKKQKYKSSKSLNSSSEIDPCTHLIDKSVI